MTEVPTPVWDGWLSSRFPAYLLPSASRVRLSREEAERFLERAQGRREDLELLRAVSVVVAGAEALVTFVEGHLPDLVRTLPSRTEVQRRFWSGGFYGLLDLPATLARRQTGDTTSFVTRHRRRSFDLPESILVSEVAHRLLDLLTDLRARGILTGSPLVASEGRPRHPFNGAESGEGEGDRWTSRIANCEGQLRHLLTRTVLGDVERAPVEGFHIQAARMATHPAYNAAVEWYERLREGLDTDDPVRIAEALREGALRPLAAATRFELAVLLKLVETLEVEMASSGWMLDLGIIRRDRRDVARLVKGDREIHFFYNQGILERGPLDRGYENYFGILGHARPDITVTFQRVGVEVCSWVVEVKHSEDRDYLTSGYAEAWLYRWEYQRHLTGWPKAMLVASGSVPGRIRREDEVVATSWPGWVPAEVVDAIREKVES